MTSNDHEPRPPVLLSLGSINADFQVRIDEPPGQTETLAARELRRFSGGKAANVALLARRLGHPAWLLGRIGDDELAEQALGPLRAAGVDVESVRRGSGNTAVSMIMVPPGGKKHIVLAGEANLAFDDADIAALEHKLRQAPPDSVLVADYEVSARAVSRALAAARAGGLRVVVDPSFPRQVPREDLQAVDALTPNASEALALAGIEGKSSDDEALAAAARRLASFGPRSVCIKLEDGGCLLLHEGELLHQPAPEVQVDDSTGAGDAFTGAFAVALLEGRPVREAVARAVATSAIAVTRYGSQPAYPDRQGLEARLAELPPSRPASVTAAKQARELPGAPRAE
jgi:ribokinase